MAASRDFKAHVALTGELSLSGARAHETSLLSRGFQELVWPYLLLVPLMYIVGAYVHAKKSILRAHAYQNEYRRLRASGVADPVTHLRDFKGPKPKTNAWIFDGLSASSRRVKEGAARWPALDAVYNFVPTGRTAFARLVDSVWLNIRNAQAVRNRLIIVERELGAAIRDMHNKHPGRPVNVLSLAAGAAQAVVDVVADLKHEGISVNVLAVDIDPTALVYADELARRCAVRDSFTLVEGNVIRFSEVIGDFAPDIVEMCGLTDYLRDKAAIPLLKEIGKRLTSGGYYITCHIHPNAERYFLWHAVDWQMLYRSLPVFRKLLEDGGFMDANYYTEPQKIHTVAVARNIAR